MENHEWNIQGRMKMTAPPAAHLGVAGLVAVAVGHERHGVPHPARAPSLSRNAGVCILCLEVSGGSLVEGSRGGCIMRSAMGYARSWAAGGGKRLLSIMLSGEASLKQCTIAAGKFTM
jgi:hypothetical protein